MIERVDAWLERHNERDQLTGKIITGPVQYVAWAVIIVAALGLWWGASHLDWSGQSCETVFVDDHQEQVCEPLDDGRRP